MTDARQGSTLLDVTDLVEFFTRQESPSGVQRVVAETAPRLLEAGAVPTILDRTRGVFVLLTLEESSVLLGRGHGTRVRAEAAERALLRARTAPVAEIDPNTVMLFTGAVWINDALMLAARASHNLGARLVFLLYDLTPVFEAGHTAAVNLLFERYLVLIAQTASRVPAISRSTRHDFEHWCSEHAGSAPPGAVTGLPTALNPASFDLQDEPWPRPYALFVGTIESRKNHAIALAAWKELVRRHGPEAVPDLVCVGRLGWHADEFLTEFVSTGGLEGKVSLLTTSVPDDALASFYKHAEFTIYPSRYEGWGLPVSESIVFGTPVIAADNSSLREAGGEAAVYVPTSDTEALVSVVESLILDDAVGDALRTQVIEHAPPTPSWADVADMLWCEAQSARSQEVPVVLAEVQLGHEYCLGPIPDRPDGAHADVYLNYLTGVAATPILGQQRNASDVHVTDAAVIGRFGSPQTWGLEIRPGMPITIRFRRPSSEALTVLIATRSMPGRVVIEAAGPGGPVRQEVYLGSLVRLALGAGPAGSLAQTTFSVVDARDSLEGFLGIRSFLVLPSDDLHGQILAMEAAARALRQELDFITGTRSWKVTAPLRRWKGRSAN